MHAVPLPMTDVTISGKLSSCSVPSLAPPPTFWEQAAASLRFEYSEGAVTPIAADYRVSTRTLPFLMVAQVTEGAVRFELESGEEWTAFAGEAVCIAPGGRHRAENTSRRLNVSRWAHVNWWVFGAVSLTTLFPMGGVVRGEAALRLGDINAELARLDASSDAQKWPSLLRRQALGLEMAALLCQSNEAQLSDWAHAPTMERLLPALSYIEEHLGEPMTRAQLARQVHLSPSHFALLFKATLGLSPGDYARGQQQRRAQQHLLSTTRSVAQIARECGFGNEFHFSRFFKARFGVSPLHYRRQMHDSRGAGF